jgi:predicted nucleic acid-binding protein
MTVVDASVVVEHLVDGPAAEVARGWLRADHHELWAPHLIDAEVGHALRSNVARGTLSARAAKSGLREVGELPLRRQDHQILLETAWALRANVSFYDALYVALASVSEQPLITLDSRLAGVPGLPAEVELLAA